MEKAVSVDALPASAYTPVAAVAGESDAILDSGCLANGKVWPLLREVVAMARYTTDIFSDEVCIAFGRLHEQVAAPWSPSLSPDEIKAELEADNCPLRQLDSKPVASGSIAEVYFGELQDGTPVAVKCMRPGIRPVVEGDLAWLLWAASWTDRHPTLRMYALKWAAELFCNQVYMQTDFRVEADNYNRFYANFHGETNVIRFPKTYHASKDFLVISKEKGEELSKVFREADGYMASKPDLAKLSKTPQGRAEALCNYLGISREMGSAIAKESIAVYMRMLFKDSFVHGDLHPGNILLRIRNPDGEGHPEGKSFRDSLPTPLRLLVEEISPKDPGFDLVLLDCGLAVPLPQHKVELLRSTTTAILYADYDKAADLTFQMSPDASSCQDPQKFKKELGDIFRASRRATWENGFLQLSDAGLACLDLVRKHHVHLDATFSWAILALLSVEGAGRQLDPNVDATGAATRYLISFKNLVAEMNSGSFVSAKEMLTQMAMEKVGIDFWAFRNWRLGTWNQMQHAAQTSA
eukprot:CAMPEP_0206470054 /NCGR_PEP_ID=MMETSP0324_2-20121206/30684_1 /ASSEMBLY_ACC=CAM_ASM_000836 /TAXON_ID=2866 /ORGANISM="Crypthecodinium cohnii, Strain Seligo" /LENGTH=522 /DNA_ID=CAMNT_0053944005 /DNA_START=312 /DNA_END=1881 /DNA_ORIENTATION=+